MIFDVHDAAALLRGLLSCGALRRCARCLLRCALCLIEAKTGRAKGAPGFLFYPIAGVVTGSPYLTTSVWGTGVPSFTAFACSFSLSPMVMSLSL